MGRKNKLEKNEQAKKRAFQLYKQGKTYEEIAQQINLEFPLQVSKSSVHRLIQRYKDILKLTDVSTSEEDIDLMSHSQQLSVIANGMITELLVEWQEKGTITEERLKAILDLLTTTSSVAKTTAQIEKIKTALIQHIEKILEKVSKVLDELIEDEALKTKILVEIRKELEK